MGDWEAGWEVELGIWKRDRKVKVRRGKVKGVGGGKGIEEWDGAKRGRIEGGRADDGEDGEHGRMEMRG